jgi:predicted MFS family arabinose efflux permease
MFHDPRQRAVAVSVWISAFSAGSAVGPVLGGVMLEHFWWGSVFLLALPVMALLLVLGPIVLPEYRDPEAGRLDLPSAILSLVAVLSVIFGLKQIAQDGFSALPVVAIVGGLVAGGVFVRRQLTLPQPMVDLRLFRIPAFSGSLAINFVSIFVAVGYFLFIAQYLQLVLGLSPLTAGLWSLPSAVGFIVGSQVAPRLVRVVRPAYIIGAGLAMAAIGLLVLTQVGATGGLAPLVLASLVISLGLAPVLTITTDLIAGSAPPEQAGAASGISETGAELGGALGIAILGRSAPRSTARTCRRGCPRASPTRPRARRGTRWVARSAPRRTCPRRPRPASSTSPATRSSSACTSRRRSRRSSPSAWRSSRSSSCATSGPTPAPATPMPRRSPTTSPIPPVASRRAPRPDPMTQLDAGFAPGYLPITTTTATV